MVSVLLLLLLVFSYYNSVTVSGNKVLRLQLKTQLHSQPKSVSLVSSNTSEPLNLLLKTNDNIEYYATLGMGTPPQYFKVIFDTGSADTWLPSSNCLRENTACWLHNRYDASKSQSYVKQGRNFTVHYGVGAVRGYLSQDTLHIGDVQLKNFIFGEITHHHQEPFATTRFDGLVGLAQHEIALQNTTPFFEALCQQKLVPSCVFSVYLCRVMNSTYGGQLLLGGIDNQLYVGPLHYVPLTNSGYWQFKINDVFVGKQLMRGPFNAIVDTGTTFMLIPLSKYMDLMALIFKKSYTGLIVNCRYKDFPSIYLSIGDGKFELRPFDYLIKFDTWLGSFCRCALQPFQSNFWILGDLFLTRYYTVFDRAENRIGFATAVKAENTEDYEEIEAES